MKSLVLTAGILTTTICTALLSGCATVDVNDPNAAVVNVEFRDFPKSMLGNNPFIRKLNGEIVLNVRKKTFRLLPGEYTAQVQQKSMGVACKADIQFTIPSKGNYKLVITKTGGGKPLKGQTKLEAESELIRTKP